MGDSIPKEANLVMSNKNHTPSYVVVSRSRASLKRLREFRVRNGSLVSEVALFVVKVAALEAVRRLSRAKCPWIWRGFQALQFLCYPPFKWFRRFAPFKAIVDNLQMVSKPLLALSIATAITDELEFGRGDSDDVNDSSASPDVLSGDSSLETSVVEEPQNVASKRWLVQLHNELERQGLSLPERINEEELHRFYTAANRDFASFMTSIKKTIRWRETYGILSVQELEKWSNLVFWHGFDVNHRPCLIVRLGLACISLPAHDKPRFSQAIISQVDHGVIHLLDANISKITVVVDCEGLTPLKIPMQVLRTCSSILQDHFPNRLGCLFVVRLPPMLRVIAQTFIQVLKPHTREKLRIEGKMYRKILSECLEALPSYLGGLCLCKICSEINTSDMQQPFMNGIMKRKLIASACDDGNLCSPSTICETEAEPDRNCEQLLRNAIVSIVMFLVLVALIGGFLDPGSSPFFPS